MQQGRFNAKALFQARNELRRQSDLRNEHQHLTACIQNVFHEVQIDFRLAAAGDAVKQ